MVVVLVVVSEQEADERRLQPAGALKCSCRL